MVAAYHIWIGRVSGGIDVFLLISSFLLMQTFMRRIDNSRHIALVGYWLKAFKRLLPPAIVTILFTVIAVQAFFPAERIRGVLREAVASICYYENWFLAVNSFDYYADKSVVSPLQHFWSLSIQGQIFLLWPAIIAVCWFLGRKINFSVRQILTLVFGVIFGGSLIWSIIQTNTNQSYAYFSTWTRLWEFALGALLALILPGVERFFGYGPGKEFTGSRSALNVRVGLGWFGLIAMLLCGVLVDVQGMFPGYVALWPTGAAVLVLIAGNTGVWYSADRILSSRPLKFLGDISYALYLAHWPVLITTLQLTGSSQLNIPQGFVVLAVSIAFATVLTKYLDAPIRYSVWAAKRHRNSLAIILASLLVGLVPVISYQTIIQKRLEKISAVVSVDNPGALVLSEDFEDYSNKDKPIKPLREQMEDEWAAIDGVQCDGEFRPNDETLADGCRVGHNDRNKVAVVTGNSRVEQYLPFLEPALQKNGWTIVELLRGGCSFISPDEESYQRYKILRGETRSSSDFSETFSESVGVVESPVSDTSNGPSCLEWSKAVDEYIEKINPDLVIAASTYVPNPGDQSEEIVPGFDKIVEKYTSRGIQILGIRDEPRLKQTPFECMDPIVENGLKDLDEKAAYEIAAKVCTQPMGEIYSSQDPAKALTNFEREPGKLYLFDPTPWICPDGECPLIVGNLFVYMDSYHMTSAYTRSMYPLVEDKLDEILISAAGE